MHTQWLSVSFWKQYVRLLRITADCPVCIDLSKEDWLDAAYDTVKNDYRKWMVTSAGTETKNYLGEMVAEMGCTWVRVIFRVVGT